MNPRAHNLESQLRTVYSESLRSCHSGDEARVWLASQGVKQMIEELALVNDHSLAEFEQTHKPTVAILNQPELIHFADVADATVSCANQLLRAVESPLVLRHWPLAGIWRSYATALVAFHRNKRVPCADLKPRGFEKYYVPYVEYMCAVTSTDRDVAKARAIESFVARNREKRFTDWLGLDGDGEKPVLWDFRMYSIEAVGLNPAQHP